MGIMDGDYDLFKTGDESYFNSDNFSLFDSGNESSSFFSTDDSGWDNSWDNIFSFDFDTWGGSGSSNSEDSGFWKGVWDMANTELGTGVIGGVAGGIMNYQNQGRIDDRFDQTRLDKLANDAKYFALQEKKLGIDQQMADLEGAKLSDKIGTRQRHNTSINKPGGGSKKVTFG